MLVTGAAAGTGTFAIQIATALGARVYVTTSSEEKLARCVALGAVGGADWRDPDWHETIRAATGGGVDVALDSAGGDAWDGILRAIRPGRDAGQLRRHGRRLRARSRWRSCTGGSATSTARRWAVRASSRRCSSTSRGDPWRPVIDSTFPLSETAEAFRRLDDPARFGKIVLAIS